VISIQGSKQKMFKTLKDKFAISGVTVLFIGVALLMFTFFSAYGFLTTDLSPISTQDLVQTFGESLGPLIAAAIHIMYLGVMGWISSLITIRGVTLMVNVHKAEAAGLQASQQRPQPQLKQAKAKPARAAKPEVEPSDPEMIVIPLEEMEQRPQAQQKSK
jgi:hypothetical protein